MLVGVIFSFVFMFVLVPLLALAVFPSVRAIWIMAALFGFGGAALGLLSQPYGPAPPIVVNSVGLALGMTAVFGGFFFILRWLRNRIAAKMRTSLASMRALSVLGTILFWLSVAALCLTVWVVLNGQFAAGDIGLMLGSGFIFYGAIAILTWIGMSKVHRHIKNRAPSG